MSNSSYDKPRTRVLQVAGFGLCNTILAATTAMAQSGSAADGTKIEEIVVTGSHIQRDGYSGLEPIQTLDTAAIEASGSAQFQDLLKHFPSNSGSLLPFGEDRQTGTSQFSLRGLGLSSTLTLLNGKRVGITPLGGLVGTGEDFTDINQFPLAMVKRVEVLKDGASAIYGSEAVAGVVNIITRKGFEGLEISGEYRSPAQFTDSSSINIAMGKYGDDGGFNVYASYYTQDITDFSEIDWYDKRILGNGDRRRSRLLSTTGAPGSYQRAFINANGLPETLPGALRLTDPDCEAAGGLFALRDDGTLDSSRCRFDFAEQAGIESAQTRLQVFAEGDYQISDKLKYYVEASFSQNQMDHRAGSGFFSNGLTVGANAGKIYIPADHPFNFFIEDPNNPAALVYVGPEAWDPAVNQAVDLTCECRPLGTEFNGKNSRYDRETEWNYLRVLNGLKFKLDNGWGFDLSHMYSRGTLLTTEPNYRADIFNNLVLSGEFNPFGTRLANPNLISPKDGVSTAVNEEDTILQFEGFDQSQTEVVQNVFDFIATGDLFELPTGTVGVAVGAQYRDLKRTAFPEPLLSASEADTPAVVYLSKGTQDVTAGFVEAVVPLGDRAEVQMAVRHESYGGSVGSTTDPKIGVLFSPTDWLTLRGSWGTSFQAPSLTQTSEALSRGLVNDSAVPVAGGGIACGPGGAAINYALSVKGSDDLAPQSADNLNVGFVLAPADTLTLRADYWRTNYSDLIAASEAAQAIVDNDCSGDGIPNDPRVLRDGSGQIYRINTEIINVGKVVADGVDLGVMYGFDAGGAGRFLINLEATYVMTFDITDGGTTISGLGSRNFRNNFGPQPELRANLAIDWTRDRHNVNAGIRHIDSYKNDQSNNATIDSHTVVDLQYRVDISDLFGSSDGETSVAVGADNVFDTDPPALNRLDASGNPITGINQYDRPGFDSRVHDMRGRMIYVRAKHRF